MYKNNLLPPLDGVPVLPPSAVGAPAPPRHGGGGVTVLSPRLDPAPPTFFDVVFPVPPRVTPAAPTDTLLDRAASRAPSSAAESADFSAWAAAAAAAAVVGRAGDDEAEGTTEDGLINSTPGKALIVAEAPVASDRSKGGGGVEAGCPTALSFDSLGASPTPTPSMPLSIAPAACAAAAPDPVPGDALDDSGCGATAGDATLPGAPA